MVHSILEFSALINLTLYLKTASYVGLDILVGDQNDQFGCLFSLRFAIRKMKRPGCLCSFHKKESGNLTPHKEPHWFLVNKAVI